MIRVKERNGAIGNLIAKLKHSSIGRFGSRPSAPWVPVALPIAYGDHCISNMALKEIFDCRSVTDSTRGAGHFLPKVVLTFRQYVLSYYLTEDERLDYDNYSYTATSKPAERRK